MQALVLKSRFLRFGRRVLIWGAPALLAACAAGMPTPDDLLIQQRALLDGSAEASAPAANDPTVTVTRLNGAKLCQGDCPAQVTVAAGHVTLAVKCGVAVGGKTDWYDATLVTDVMAGHVYRLVPAVTSGGCAVSTRDITRSREKPESSDNPGIRG